MSFNELTDNQRRVYIDTVQVYGAYLDAMEKNRSYRGGMHWKKVKGKEYLFRSRGRYGHGESLGPRSPETEEILANFQAGKQQMKERLDSLRARLDEQARVCKAALIQRVPSVVTGILRLLAQHEMLGRNLVVIGTNALYAYEAAGGVSFDTPIMATEDMDILWDTRSKLTLAANRNIVGTGLIGILRKADRSFEASGAQRFRAINKDGYMVDLIKPLPRNALQRGKPSTLGESGDLVATELRNLQWLVSSPKFSQVVIGQDGYPALMIVPDPRAFALHKLWMSGEEDREPVKKVRDRDQAVAVAKLMLQYLPQYRFNAVELRMFPRDVVQSAERVVEELQSPAGLDYEY